MKGYYADPYNTPVFILTIALLIQTEHNKQKPYRSFRETGLRWSDHNPP